MGLNYYLHTSVFQSRIPLPSIHIGKSSYGWTFALHVMPEWGINTLDDWRDLWSRPSTYILDSEGRRVTVEEMERAITERKPSATQTKLERSAIDGVHCIGHGEGTWDYCTGDFS